MFIFSVIHFKVFDAKSYKDGTIVKFISQHAVNVNIDIPIDIEKTKPGENVNTIIKPEIVNTPNVNVLPHNDNSNTIRTNTGVDLDDDTESI